MANDKEPSEDFAALLNEFEAKQGKRPRRQEVEVGDTVRGRIVAIGRDALFVDMGQGKAEAVLELDEVRDADGGVTVKVGDEIEARVVEIGGKKGGVLLRRTLGRGAEGKAELAQAHQLGVPVEGTISSVNKGGVEVLIAGVRAFCPISQLEMRHVEDAASYVGRKFSFKITRYEEDRRGMNLVVSRRALLEEEARARAVETRAKLAVGAVVTGVVTAIRDFGAFVDLGGLEGMLHVSELGWQRGARAADVLGVGQHVEVQIIKIEQTTDPKRPERISLSLKSLTRDPWDDAADRLTPGSKLKGKVARVEPFGAFVELEPGVDGLLHVDELAGGRQVRHARELAKPGDEIEVTVLSVDRERRRISLGTGDRPDSVDPADLAAARSDSGGKLGTLGDLFRAAAEGREKKG